MLSAILIVLAFVLFRKALWKAVMFMFLYVVFWKLIGIVPVAIVLSGVICWFGDKKNK